MSALATGTVRDRLCKVAAGPATSAADQPAAGPLITSITDRPMPGAGPRVANLHDEPGSAAWGKRVLAGPYWAAGGLVATGCAGTALPAAPGDPGRW